MFTGRRPELPYPLKEVECADGTEQRIYPIPDTDKARMLADLYPSADAPAIDGTLFDLHERKPIKARNFLQSREMLVDWIAPPRVREGDYGGREGGPKTREVIGKQRNRNIYRLRCYS